MVHLHSLTDESCFQINLLEVESFSELPYNKTSICEQESFKGLEVDPAPVTNFLKCNVDS